MITQQELDNLKDADIAELMKLGTFSETSGYLSYGLAEYSESKNDLNDAATYYRIAAEKGHPDALFSWAKVQDYLGKMGMEVRDFESHYWAPILMKAMEYCNTIMENNLETKAERKEIIDLRNRLSIKAAEAFDAMGDKESAIHCLDKACESGCAGAILEQGVILFSRASKTKNKSDFEKSFNLLNRFDVFSDVVSNSFDTINQRHLVQAKGLYCLALFYLEGIVNKVNLEKAEGLFKQLATYNWSTNAVSMLVEQGKQELNHFKRGLFGLKYIP